MSPRGPYVSDFLEMGCRWVEWSVIRQVGWPWQELGSLLSLSKIYQKEKPTIIHQHTLKAVVYGSFASWLAHGSVLVNSIAGRGLVYSSRKFLHVLLHHIINLSLFVIDRVAVSAWIFENRYDLDYFTNRKLIIRGKTHLIEGVGVDLEKFEVLPELDGTPTILYVGRFLWSKGVGLLVEAVRLLKGRGVELNCVLVGEPDKGNPDSVDEKTLRQWTKAGLVNWVGWQKETAAWYQKANLFVFPTTYGEGVPTVLLEAAASGRAIVTTDHPGCTEVVKEGENGTLIPAGDVLAFADAIARLLSDPDLRHRMGRAGRRLVEQRFLKPLINERTLAIYAKAVAD